MNNTSLLRIIDANLNRVAEGMRVLEDIARFSLNDAALSASLKKQRQQLNILPSLLTKELLWQRQSDADYGQNHPSVKGAEQREDLLSLVTANSKRAQEALRVLEEAAKEPYAGLNSDLYKKTRFSLYSVQKELTARLERRQYASYMQGVYLVLDTSILPSDKLAQVAIEAIKGGCRLFQLRDKALPKKQLLALARELSCICRQNEALLIINDYADIAILSQAHGLHVGQSDLPPQEARQLLPPDVLLGVSVDTIEEAQEAQKAGADYAAVGAIFPTATKEIKVLGLSKLQEIAAAVSLPLWGIGGIKKENAAEVIKAGACGACVVTAVLQAPDHQKAVQEFTDKLYYAKNCQNE